MLSTSRPAGTSATAAGGGYRRPGGWPVAEMEPPRPSCPKEDEADEMLAVQRAATVGDLSDGRPRRMPTMRAAVGGQGRPGRRWRCGGMLRSGRKLGLREDAASSMAGLTMATAWEGTATAGTERRWGITLSG